MRFRFNVRRTQYYHRLIVRMITFVFALQFIILSVNSEVVEQNELYEIVKHIRAEGIRMKTTLEALQQDIRLLKSENHGLKKEIANMRKNGHLHSEICDAIVGMNEEGMDEDLAKLLYHKRFLIPPKGTTIPPRGTTESVKTTSASNTETPKAAFSAFLNNPIDWSTSGKQFTAVFDSVVSNVGGAYDPTTGIFTAQTKGTYYFSSAVKSDGHHFNEIYLITNNDIVCSWDKGADESGSVATVITLDAGERVYVQHYLWRKDYSNIWYSASFTGFQI